MTIKNLKQKFALLIGSSLIAASILLYLSTIPSCSLSRNYTRNLQAEQSSGKQWATPISLPGLPNLYKVSDSLYRGAQPTKEGLDNLKKLGIKTIIDLRTSHPTKIEGSDPNYDFDFIDMRAWHPKDEQVIEFLKTVSDKSKTPVFVHCHYGSDRTGTMCAIYRIAIEDWSKQQAIDEMTKGGFGFHPAWHNLITYIEKLDTEKIRRD